jgi:large subunit ribosomal protein L20
MDTPQPLVHQRNQMPRATNSAASRKRRKRVLKAAKGFRGARSKLFRYAKDAVRKAKQYNYRDRKVRKRTFRQLWIARINAAARNHGLTYNRLIEGLIAGSVEVDRKVLADMAVHDDDGFAKVVEQAKAALEAKQQAAANASAAEAPAA